MLTQDDIFWVVCSFSCQSLLNRPHRPIPLREKFVANAPFQPPMSKKGEILPIFLREFLGPFHLGYDSMWRRAKCCSFICFDPFFGAVWPWSVSLSSSAKCCPFFRQSFGSHFLLPFFARAKRFAFFAIMFLGLFTYATSDVQLLSTGGVTAHIFANNFHCCKVCHHVKQGQMHPFFTQENFCGPLSFGTQGGILPIFCAFSRSFYHGFY